jgi:thermitase
VVKVRLFLVSIYLSIAASLAVFVFFVAGIADDGARQPTPVLTPGEVLVRWKVEPAPETLAELGGYESVPLQRDNVVRLSVPDGRELGTAEALRARPDVVWAQPDFVREVAVSSNDPRFGDQWGLRRIDAPAAWDTTTGTSSVVVAVVDTGVDLRHPDLEGHLVDGHNFVREDRPPQDDNGHGTHVAGTIAATLNNNTGIAGVAPNVSVMPVKVFGRTGRSSDSSVAAGLYWAVDHGAWVVNLSFGPASSGTQATPMVDEAIQYANGMGAVVVLAAGNRGTSEPPTLSQSQGVISVAATMPNDMRAPFSNHGPWVHVGAPGTGIMSTFFDGTSTYRAESGTSVAAPYVSGVAALLLSIRPWLSPAQIDGILRATADPVPGQDVGAGRLNAARAVAAARDLPSPAPAPTTQPTSSEPDGPAPDRTPAAQDAAPTSGGSTESGPLKSENVDVM